jgi:uncharacterized protein YbjQ (UPF0145 family)
VFGASEVQGAAGASSASRSAAPSMLVVTTPQVPGMRITEVYGDVFGVSARSRNTFSDAGAGLKSLVGGEVRGYTRLLADCRSEAMQRLREDARRLGANAVVGMGAACTQVGDVVHFMTFGAAVSVERLHTAAD